MIKHPVHAAGGTSERAVLRVQTSRVVYAFAGLGASHCINHHEYTQGFGAELCLSKHDRESIHILVQPTSGNLAAHQVDAALSSVVSEDSGSQVFGHGKSGWDAMYSSDGRSPTSRTLVVVSCTHQRSHQDSFSVMLQTKDRDSTHMDPSFLVTGEIRGVRLAQYRLQ